jgi:hypothetical protein
MANDANNIRFAPNGAMYLAPAPTGATGSTVLPVAPGDGKTPPTGYTSVGYIADTGVTITPQVNTNPVNVWQSAVPVLYNVKDATFSIKAMLSEVNVLTTETFYGATWVKQTGTTPTWKLDLSSVPELKELSIVVDWQDQGRNYRVVVPRAMVADRGAITLQRTTAQTFELTFDALDFNGSLGYVLTDDAAVDDAAQDALTPTS